MEAIIALLMISCLASQALCQDVETRGQDKVRSDGGQRGTIYSQRHLSPHRMMHFGKRPAIPAPPVIVTPQVYDLYQQQQQQQEVQEDSKYPYLLYLELERGKTLQALPNELPSTDLMYSVNRPELKFFRYTNSPADELQQQQVAAADKPLEGQRFLKLISAQDSASSSQEEQVNSSQASGSQDDSGSQPQQAISVSSRSIPSPSARASSLNLPKAYISSLFARQGSSSLPSYGLFNKKAEPKENYFMHFGRK